MSDFKTQLKKCADEIRLRESEKEQLFGELSAYMEYNPLREGVRARGYARGDVYTLVRSRFAVVFVVLALVFTSGIGVTFASNDALPGDPLYGVKLAREEVAQRLIPDPAARAEFAIERAHERLEEVEALAARGALSSEQGTRAAARFARQRAEARAQIERVAQESPGRAEALRVALSIGADAHAATLAFPVGDLSGEKDTSASIASAPRERPDRDGENAVRARVALAVRTEVASGGIPAAAGGVATQVAADASDGVQREEVSTFATMTAEDTQPDARTDDAATMALEAASETSARVNDRSDQTVVTELMRMLNKEREKLAKARKQLSNTQTFALEAFLERLEVEQRNVASDIERDAYTTARRHLEALLRDVYTARSALANKELDLRTVLELRPLPGEASDTPLPLHKEAQEEANSDPTTSTGATKPDTLEGNVEASGGLDLAPPELR